MVSPGITRIFIMIYTWQIRMRLTWVTWGGCGWQISGISPRWRWDGTWSLINPCGSLISLKMPHFNGLVEGNSYMKPGTVVLCLQNPAGYGLSENRAPPIPTDVWKLIEFGSNHGDITRWLQNITPWYLIYQPSFVEAKRVLPHYFWL